MDIIVSILALITGTDDIEPQHSLPECNFTTIVNECVVTMDGQRPVLVNEDDNTVLIYSV